MSEGPPPVLTTGEKNEMRISIQRVEGVGREPADGAPAAAVIFEGCDGDADGGVLRLRRFVRDRGAFGHLLRTKKLGDRAIKEGHISVNGAV
eukprot:CAMPEP_0194337406 /NCGR_PEP_ID=MMETSP0171-20130528/76191_1 /TAXON_ID=218684 /ORGANISM="Corethron pennatum, Strain L29A3" /LENGTH=91 /DNA_ID=CAMNT_0039101173 /DNA_START=42 /DNA_END=313 /DNA_ORIENTATION=-